MVLFAPSYREIHTTVYHGTHQTLVTLQAEDLPVRWLVTRTNSTWSPGWRLTLSFTSDIWKNSFFPSSTSCVRNPNKPWINKYQISKDTTTFLCLLSLQEGTTNVCEQDTYLLLYGLKLRRGNINGLSWELNQDLLVYRCWMNFMGTVFGKLTVINLLKNSLPFGQLKGSLVCSQQLTMWPYSESHESSPSAALYF